uniref:AMP-binding enzyme n=1 Tax=Sodalis sp. (in: enterobacteria) TaxID=1898979 RepID=UPI003872BD50
GSGVVLPKLLSNKLGVIHIPEVMQACVVPINDDVKGQKPVAFVVRHQGKQITEEEIKRFVLAHAPAYQHPRRVFFLDALPLAATNKIDRKQLIQRAEANVK